MRQERRDAEDRLLSILRPMEQAVVAYSGGVDSALLATAARRAAGFCMGIFHETEKAGQNHEEHKGHEERPVFFCFLFFLRVLRALRG